MLGVVFAGLLAASSGQDVQKEHFDSGKLKAEYGVDPEGRKHGKYTEYYESGKKRIAATYDHGLLTGEWWEFYESGKPFGKKGYDRGKPAGGIVRMDENGVVLYRASISKGQPTIYRDFKQAELAYERTEAEIRKQIEAIDPVAKRYDVAANGMFDVEPSSKPPYRAGKLKAAYLEDALKHFNVYRYLSGLSPTVKLDDSYNDECQHAALVNAANGKMDHTPDRPAGMDASMHAKGYKGASASNLHRGQSTLRQAVDGWMGDTGANNMDEVGHRAWCQNPILGRVGFGQCDGYAAQYSLDKGGKASYGELIAYPSPGYYPVEYFESDAPWSIGPKESRFKLPKKDEVGVRMWLLDEGFDFVQELEVHHKTVFSETGGWFNVESVGFGPRVIFSPTLPSGFEWEGKRVWALVLKNGAPQFGTFVHFFKVAEKKPESEESR